MSKSTVYLTGAGPGDCKLITVKALELIKRAECIIYDYLVNPGLLKFANEDCKLIYVGKKAKAHTLSQNKINQLLVRQAKLYNTVVRLKGGDPFIFGRGAEEALYLKSKRVNFEIVPGISSAIAVPAYAGIPLTYRAANSTVGFITGNEDPTKKESAINWDALVKALGTMVFLMGVKNLPLIVQQLINCGKPENTPIALIRWGTTSGQQTVKGNLGNIVELSKRSKIRPPAIIVVGEVVKLNKELNWFENRPFFGKRILVTRTRHQASSLSERFIDLGAEVIEIPTIKIISLKADRKLEDAFLCNKYDWVFFSSQNGVQEFSQVLDRINKDSRILGKAKVCTIGSETAKSLNSIGIKPDYLPPKYISEEVVKHFNHSKFRGKRVLILRAKQARDILPQGLRKAGLIIDVIDLYDTRIYQESKSKLKEAFAQKVDLITFTSSSTVNNFISLLGKNYRNFFKGVKIAVIGPITSRTVREFGLKVNIEAKLYTIEGLVEAIKKSYNFLGAYD